MISTKQRKLPKLVIQQYSNIICPNTKQADYSSFLSSVIVFDCKNIHQLVNRISQEYCILTTGKAYSQTIQMKENQTSKQSMNQNKISNNQSQYALLNTKYSFSQRAEQYLAIYCQKSSEMNSGINKVISIDQILHSLTTQQIQNFQQIKFPFNIKQQLIDFNKNKQVNSGLNLSYLPILYKQDSQMFIRWHPEAIVFDKLNEQQLKYFQIISKIIRNSKASIINLQQNQGLIIHNGKFLHQITQITDSQQLLYRIRFNINPNIQGHFKINLPYNNQTYNQQLKKYIQNFSKDLSQKDKLSASQSFFSLQSFKLESSFSKLQILKTSLNSFYKTVVKLYSCNNQIGQYLRKILNLPNQINMLIDQMNQKIPYEIGFYKPKFILQEVQTNIFMPKICNVNVVSVLKQLILSLQLQKLSFVQENQNIKQNKVYQIMKKMFKNQKLIHLITTKQQFLDSLLLNYMKNTFGIQIKILKIQNIKSEKINNNIQNLFDLDEAEIKCVIYDLDRQQYIQFAQKHLSILRFLIFNKLALNDLRSIFIANDQRLFSILNQKTQFSEELSLNYLFHAQIPILRKYIIPTYVIQSTTIDEKFITQNKDDWIIKLSYNQEKKIIFGSEIDNNNWLQLIKQKNGFIIQKFIKPLQIPIICSQNLKQSAQVRVKIYNSICTFFCYNNQFLGIGSTLASESKNIDLLSKVTVLPTMIQQKNIDNEGFNYYEKINNIKIYKKDEIKKFCEEKYGRIINKMSKADILKNNQRNQAQQRWKNSYISPSGGSTNNSCYIFNEIDQNHYLRKILGKQFEENKIIQYNDVCIVIQSSTNLYRARQIFTQYCELVGATAIPLDHEATNQILLDFINYFNPNVFISAPSRLVSFCKFMEQNQSQLTKIKKILYSGQILYDNQRYLVKKIFPFAQLCSVYGSAQSGVWAYTRKGFQQNHIFNYPNQAYQLQIQNPNEFGVGKLLVTSLVRTKTPIYRFQMGQYARIINSNTFQLIARPSVLKFRILFLDFQVEQWHQLLKDTERWQIILQNIPDPKMTFKIKLRKYDETQFQQLKTKIIDHLLDRYRKVNGVQNQNDYNSLVKVVYHVNEDSQFVRCMPSNKFYYIVDRRLN